MLYCKCRHTLVTDCKSSFVFILHQVDVNYYQRNKVVSYILIDNELSSIHNTKPLHEVYSNGPFLAT